MRSSPRTAALGFTFIRPYVPSFNTGTYDGTDTSGGYGRPEGAAGGGPNRNGLLVSALSVADRGGEYVSHATTLARTFETSISVPDAGVVNAGEKNTDRSEFSNVPESTCPVNRVRGTDPNRLLKGTGIST